ncbi:MAG TPA: sensor histidine kinase [Thermoleophilaceae bacterium]|jgi:signal transduction histidine kinase|nr:sensor histidine kinase [Thermoleophilaceae bacterium]
MVRVVSAPLRVPLRPSSVDAVLALLFATGAQLEVWAGDIPGPAAAKLTLALLTTVPLAWRTVAPLAAVMVTTGGYALAVLLGVSPDEALLPLLAPLVAIYSLGAHGSTRGIVAGGGAALVAYSVASAWRTGLEASELVIATAMVLGALAVGRAVRELGFETDLLEARAEQLERERDERAKAAVAEERARIARELHDMIGHSISIMGVQAGAVRRLLAPEQEREREALLAVERTGRDAVAEMRRLLGLLRSHDDERALGELPTLQRLDDLVAELRRAGLDVDLRVEAELDDLSPGRALAVFRILQEALTNALKHARGAHVRATLRRIPGEVQIEVVDDGSPLPAPSGDGGGQGLVGMRERVALYGGTLEAGPRTDRGFVVLARLPTTGP